MEEDNVLFIVSHSAHGEFVVDTLEEAELKAESMDTFYEKAEIHMIEPNFDYEEGEDEEDE